MFDQSQRTRQKRLLALDGGGIMGMITLQFLRRMEDQLRPLSGKGDAFRLSDFFDYFGGTSTGAIIATGLALGKSVEEIVDFYERAGKDMFQKAPWWRRVLWYTYQTTPLKRKLIEVIGDKRICDLQDAGELKSLLLVVMRNATTDSPWPLSTNPSALYNDRGRADCNLNLPLWQLVRASTAAPTYFQPETIVIDRPYQFVDGGVTPYNNPALLLYRMATLPQFGLGWPLGEDRLMLVSVGTGLAFDPQQAIKSQGKMLYEVATTITGEVMRAVQVENDVNCRTIGRCVFGDKIDSELGDMVVAGPLTPTLGGHFLYARYDADVSAEGLRALGCDGIDRRLLKMDNVDGIPDFKRIGRSAAERQVDLPRQFATFMPGGG
jgi:patatin-like phospholipase/acyl hydrolase